MAQVERVHEKLIGEGSKPFEKAVAKRAALISKGSKHTDLNGDLSTARKQIQEILLKKAIEREWSAKKGWTGLHTPYFEDKPTQPKEEAPIAPPAPAEEKPDGMSEAKKEEVAQVIYAAPPPAETPGLNSPGTPMKTTFEIAWEKLEKEEVKKPVQLVSDKIRMSSPTRDRLNLAEQLSPQNAKKVSQEELDKSENVSIATEILTRVSQERDARFRQGLQDIKIEPIAPSYVAEKPEAAEKAEPELRTGEAKWREYPIKITGYIHEPGGEFYAFIEGSKAKIPFDEIVFPAKPEVPAEKTEKQPENPAEALAEARSDIKILEDKMIKMAEALRKAQADAEKKEEEEGEKEEEEEKVPVEPEKPKKHRWKNAWNKIKSPFVAAGAWLKRHPKTACALAAAAGVAATFATWGTLQYLGIYLPWRVPATEVWDHGVNVFSIFK